MTHLDPQNTTGAEEERPEEPEPSFTGVAGKSSPRGLHWDEEDEQGLSAESTRSFELWTVPASVQCTLGSREEMDL